MAVMAGICSEHVSGKSREGKEGIRLSEIGESTGTCCHGRPCRPDPHVHPRYPGPHVAESPMLGRPPTLCAPRPAPHIAHAVHIAYAAHAARGTHVVPGADASLAENVPGPI